MPVFIGKLIAAGVLLPTLLFGCAGSKTSVQKATPAQLPTPTIRFRPTRAATSTADIFELRPSNTPLATATGFAIDQLMGQGNGLGGFPADINPLTGLQVSDPTRLDRRPLVIKITNFPRSVRPQWGLNSADHVYEYYLEDELTRFIGIFYGNDAERVGPIRSARPFDEQVIRMYKGIFAFGYADDRLIDFWAESDITPFLVIEKPDNCPPMCRIGPKNSYNNLFTDTRQLTDYVTNRDFLHGRQDLSGLRFEQTTLAIYGGGLAQRLDIRYSPSSYHYWAYDPSTLRYYRWQETERKPAGEEVYEPLVDSLNTQQVYADNLVVLQVPTAYFYQSNSTEVYDFQLTGRGKGYAFREGKVFAIQWRRTGPASLIMITFPNGTAYPLKPGNTWFEVLSETSQHQSVGQTWRFLFELPEN